MAKWTFGSEEVPSRDTPGCNISIWLQAGSIYFFSKGEGEGSLGWKSPYRLRDAFSWGGGGGGILRGIRRAALHLALTPFLRVIALESVNQ